MLGRSALEINLNIETASGSAVIQCRNLAGWKIAGVSGA